MNERMINVMRITCLSEGSGAIGELGITRESLGWDEQGREWEVEVNSFIISFKLSPQFLILSLKDSYLLMEMIEMSRLHGIMLSSHFLSTPFFLFTEIYKHGR